MPTDYTAQRERIRAQHQIQHNDILILIGSDYQRKGLTARYTASPR